jgi:predicted  nucleic acid-binding Zn-ribbon protein
MLGVVGIDDDGQYVIHVPQNINCILDR